MYSMNRSPSQTKNWKCLLHESGILLETIVALFVATIAIRMLPFRRILWLAGLWPSKAGPDMSARAVIDRRIQWAVSAVAKRLPWRPLCFPQGLAAQWMLHRRGVPSTFYYGAMIGEHGVDAHVWVCDGDWPVVGGKAPEGMTVLVQVPPSADEALGGKVSKA